MSSFSLNVMMQAHFDIVRKNPNLILGGSVALYLLKVIDRDSFSDLDYAIFDTAFETDGRYNLSGVGYQIAEDKEYRCYKVDEPHTDYYYNVFVRKDIHIVQVKTEKYGLILCQHSDQIMKYKKLWLRPKDVTDLF